MVSIYKARDHFVCDCAYIDRLGRRNPMSKKPAVEICGADENFAPDLYGRQWIAPAVNPPAECPLANAHSVPYSFEI
jgi:hypothetical protein